MACLVGSWLSCLKNRFSFRLGRFSANFVHRRPSSTDSPLAIRQIAFAGHAGSLPRTSNRVE